VGTFGQVGNCVSVGHMFAALRDEARAKKSASGRAGLAGADVLVSLGASLGHLIRPILSPVDLAPMGAVKPSRDAAFQLTQRCMPVRSVWGKAVPELRCESCRSRLSPSRAGAHAA
jgi:hypothetical protein